MLPPWAKTPSKGAIGDALGNYAHQVWRQGSTLVEMTEAVNHQRFTGA